MRRSAALLAGFALIAVLAGGCGKKSAASGGKIVVAVDVPVTGNPYIAETIKHGVQLAASNVSGTSGGVLVGKRSYALEVKLYDNHGSAR
ncbi:MAG: hypothetical protein ACXVZ2_09795 [Gaiellaceae bacterium]